MAKIIVNPETLRQNATQIRNERAKFDETIARTKAIANSMGGEFEGEASKAFLENLQSYDSTFVEVGELIESFAKKLDNTANVMEETDTSVANSNSL